MKRILLFIACVLASITMQAQAEGEYESLLSEDIVWTNWCKPSINPDEYPNYYVYEEFKLKGDTVINDNSYKKVYSRRWTSYDRTPSEWSFDYSCLRQDGSKAYLYSYNRYNPKMPGTIQLIMDFSLAEGDYFSVEDSELGRWGYSPKMVKDTVLAYFPDKESRKCLFLERRRGIDAKGGGSIEDIWMEGIGSFKYGITGSMGFFGGKWQLIKCTKGGVVLFEYNEKEDKSFLKEGKTWNYVVSYRDEKTEPKKFEYKEWIEGEVFINGRTYYVMHTTKSEVPVVTMSYWREEGRKVYAYQNEDGTEKLMYDFGLAVGDKIDVQGYQGVSVKEVKTIKAHEVDRKSIFLQLGDWSCGPWVEGVGNPGLLAEPLGHDMTDGKRSVLVSCYENGECIFTADDFNEPDSSQTDYFYYYKGNKIPLTLNENKVVVSIPKDCDDITKRFLANTRTLDKIFDEYFDIFLIRRPDYNKLTMLDSWAEDAKSVILTSSYYTENHEEIFATPYLNVRLKKEEDIDLLTSYAERYKLNIVKKSPLMPLWYTLNITPDSEKNTLECANALYESGYFEASAPDFTNYVTIEEPYRPFIEDGKVWKVGSTLIRDNLVKFVEYYYFDGDTIIDGKTCKQMMCQRYVSPEHPDYAIISQLPTLSYIGAWYEENQKVYLCNEANNQFKLMYDFSVNANDTLQIMGQSYVIGPRQTRGINGFKGVYRDVMMCGEGENTYNTTWLEGVGCIDGPTVSVYLGEEGHELFLMSCTVGDEVIYYNDEYEDGATPEGLGARKRRFDFTHTIKTKPSARMRSGAKQSLYGEYNEQQLSINMNPIDDAYEVRITDESGKVVYERVVNAGSIVGLNINISAYAKGLYTVTVENNDESFKGEFETQASGIVDVRSKMEDVRKIIYNLQGQRLNTLQKGLNIVNGQKIYVK